MFSRARKGGPTLPGQDEAEDTALLSRLESVSKDPSTHPGAAERAQAGHPGGYLALVALMASRLAVVAVVAAVGYAVLFCAFWAHHARSPASYAAALRSQSPGGIPLLEADFRRNCSATDSAPPATVLAQGLACLSSFELGPSSTLHSSSCRGLLVPGLPLSLSCQACPFPSRARTPTFPGEGGEGGEGVVLTRALAGSGCCRGVPAFPLWPGHCAGARGGRPARQLAGLCSTEEA